MRPSPLVRCTTAVLMTVFVSIAASAQAKSAGSEPVPPMFRPKPPAVEPTMPPAHPFHDTRYGVTFTVPAAWELNRKDSEVSTFNLDARSIAHTTQMRAVASIGFNPHPNSTFSGAFFYFSVTPHLSSAECSAQATVRDPHTASSAEIGGIPFTHGYDEHGGICTESRDEIYTTAHNNACYRFDAVINTFCGGDVSGVQDISPRELDAVRHRMQKILDSVHFDTN
ncbi:hypothetical protein [Tunturiibacter gelidoferens]|uniref:Uncharacterized protein n=3 Tax=Tunturiibacter TaxID=3154218 RepID=A0A7Y9NMP6_9BACT|nr:hypothetical protein [Edaphobacter lichenicola]MBB5339133.1 hypothetical protein [Edaphobacter lichenicola]NYF51608.1 hypothetical protein [Edaphobacter lichenicola]